MLVYTSLGKFSQTVIKGGMFAGWIVASLFLADIKDVCQAELHRENGVI